MRLALLVPLLFCACATLPKAKASADMCPPAVAGFASKPEVGALYVCQLQMVGGDTFLACVDLDKVRPDESRL